MINVLIELVLSFVQFFAMIVTTPDIDFPDSWKDPMRYMKVVNLDFGFLKEWIPGIGDIRIYFVLISVAGPLVFVLLGLLFLNPKLVVLWYFMLVTGVMLLVAGAFGRIISEVTSLAIDNSTSEFLMYAGGAIILLCIIAWVIRRKVPWCQEGGTTATNKREMIVEETKTASLYIVMERLVYVIILVAAGLIFMGIPFDSVPESVDDSVADNFSRGMAIALFILGGLFGVWWVMYLFPKGRVVQWHISEYVESGFLKGLLITMSLAYIPIGSGCFLMFNCNSFACGPGMRLVDENTVLRANTTNVTAPSWCLPCQLGAGQVCALALQRAVCAGKDEERLEYDKSLKCTGMRTFFWPAAFLIITIFVLGLPFLFFVLIQKVTNFIQADFPLSDKEKEKCDSDQWQLKVACTQNVAKFLFSPFEFRFQYVRVFQLAQKLLIVGTSVYVYRSGGYRPEVVAILCALVIHFISSLLLSRFRPFINKFEAKIAIIMSFSLTLTCIIALLFINNVEVPGWLMIVLIILNGLLPILALVVGIVLEYSNAKNKEEAAYQERQKKIDEELKKREEADAAAEAAEEAAAAEADSAPLVEGVVVNIKPNSHEDIVENVEMKPTEVPITGIVHPVGGHRMTKEQIRARRRKIAEEIRAKVEAEMKEKMLALNNEQETADILINGIVKWRLNMFLMIAGVVILLALGCCILGIIVSEKTKMSGPFPETQTVATEFLGYANFTAFTQQCCCTYVFHDTAQQYAVVERWVCANGNVKEHVRSRRLSANTTLDGFSIRPLCAVQFNSGCSMVISPSGSIAVGCSGQSLSAVQLQMW